ncbi:MAG: transcription-repair coupling factor, partial [Alphaproteobacteria bacterium]|nr:transcription-repair coupling factor [Alphaproteobacteria bacterium]
DDPLYASVVAGKRYLGMEHWLPLFHERLATLFDYVPKAALSFDHLAEEARVARREAIADYYAARREMAKGEEGVPYRPLPPDRLYLEQAEWQGALKRRPVLAFSPFQVPDGIDAGGRRGRDFAPERADPNINVFDALAKHLGATARTGKRTVLASASPGSRDRVDAVLADHAVRDIRPVGNWTEAASLSLGQIAHAVVGFDHGFETEAFAVITEQDVLGDKLSRPARRGRRAENFLAELSALQPGDLVVHVDHGVGRFDKLRTVEIGGAPHDCLALAYDGGTLLLPVENLDMLSRFGSSEGPVALDRLGGVAWQNRKARLKKRIREMADQLMKVAAERALHHAEALQPPDGLYAEFCSRFAYEETEDQQRAIDEVIEDLAAGKPMDRLVCGDVGFGKTEVALRAAFVAVMAGRQVAVVVPTTLLARQHYRTFVERFRGLPVRIAQLSRLVSNKDSDLTRKALVAGELDVVVGTHALLGKSVSFRDLGLLVVDEEQHFGVAHKERLKQLRNDVHVLTLSATPIPRTLQLAMSGIRDLSMIATPPVDRLAVRTYVTPFDPVVVREALLRERYRGGQSFYVCPRIEDLGDVMKRLGEIVPELKTVMAHGGMAATRIEEAMQAFTDGVYDVLVSTNIVESGLDIPRANTLVVHRADMFGLAQLYQLRGRVGRSKVRAYAYMTLPPGRTLGEPAAKRLEVLQSLDHLGAGFTLASHDLDMRGAGNLLGEEQSGHIREVGVELYQDMLEQAVQEARSAQSAAPGPEEKWSPQIAIGTSVLIPEVYVPDLSIRMGLYRRVARLESDGEIEAFAAELIDRFGPLPVEAAHLIETMRIKLLCRAAHVERIEAGPKGAVIQLRGNIFPNPTGLVALISRNAARYRL